MSFSDEFDDLDAIPFQEDDLLRIEQAHLAAASSPSANTWPSPRTSVSARRPFHVNVELEAEDESRALGELGNDSELLSSLGEDEVDEIARLLDIRAEPPPEISLSVAHADAPNIDLMLMT